MTMEITDLFDEILEKLNSKENELLFLLFITKHKAAQNLLERLGLKEEWFQEYQKLLEEFRNERREY